MTTHGKSAYNNEADLDSEGIPDVEDPETVDEGMIPPRNHPLAATERGVTVAEQRAGEPFAERSRREEADIGGAGDYDEDASESVAAGPAVAAEESAMHITEEP